ncbi:MAG: hypothetical protein QXQ53_09230 [Candidatus Methanosuratincola sp.]
MAKRRVALLSESDLFGDSLEHILRGVEDIETLGPWPLDSQLWPRLSENLPDLLVIAQDKASEERVSQMTAQILAKHPKLPIIMVTLDCNELFIYTSQVLHATSADLIELIRRLPAAISFDKKA